MANIYFHSDIQDGDTKFFFFFFDQMISKCWNFTKIIRNDFYLLAKISFDIANKDNNNNQFVLIKKKSD